MFYIIMEYSNDTIILTILLIILIIVTVIHLINNSHKWTNTMDDIGIATALLASPGYKIVNDINTNNVLGGNQSDIKFRKKVKPIPDKFPEKYDEYDDMKLLVEPIENKYEYVVLDGANMIHFIMNEWNEMNKSNSKKITYFEALKHLIKVIKEIKSKNIILVLKQQKKIIKNIPSNLTIVVGEGNKKALDDNTCIFITEAINMHKKDSAILLSRDRYRDITNISGSKPSDVKIYGNDTEHINKLFANFKDKFTTIGTWSYKDVLVGYTYDTRGDANNINQTSPLWKRNVKNEAASSKIYLFRK